jgi:hypothetical protein
MLTSKGIVENVIFSVRRRYSIQHQKVIKGGGRFEVWEKMRKYRTVSPLGVLVRLHVIMYWLEREGAAVRQYQQSFADPELQDAVGWK